VDAPRLGAWKGRQHQCHQGGGLCKTCDDLHHWLVLWPKQVPIKREESRHPAAARASKSDSDRGGESGWKPVQMLTQVIEVGDARRKLNGFWDSGAQISMVTQAKVAECSMTLGKVLSATAG
jgi:hypothetical protein